MKTWQNKNFKEKQGTTQNQVFIKESANQSSFNLWKTTIYLTIQLKNKFNMKLFQEQANKNQKLFP